MPRKKPAGERLDELEKRLTRMEQIVGRLREAAPPAFWVRLLAARKPSEEQAVEPWQHLVRRLHPWRKQLYLRGRNMTARQLVGGMRANKLNEVRAAANYRLPVEAVREAVAYVEADRKLLETEAEIERLMLMRDNGTRGPQPLS